MSAMTSKDEVANGALVTLRRFPYLGARLDEKRVRQSLRGSWPDPPAPLVYWLWMASTDLAGHEAALSLTQSLEVILALLQNSKVVRGAWQKKITKLMPPNRKMNYEHVTEFRSTLFELIAAYRLVTAEAEVVIEPDGRQPGCDLSLIFQGAPLLQVEAYGPQKGARDWYESTIANPWKGLVAGTPVVALPSATPRDISMNPAAVPAALSNVLTDSNFQAHKAKQLAAAPFPALLMIRAYGLTPRFEELITVRPASQLVRAISEEAWGCLPLQCRGLLLACLGDVVHDVIRRQSPTMFLPAPNREVTPAMWEYLRQADMLTNSQIKDQFE